jgi:predicted nucleic acid-binding protein
VIILDTNVVSELMRDRPTETVIEWVDRQIGGDLYLSAISVAELLYGVARLPAGRRRRTLTSQVEGMIAEDFDHRVFSFDEAAAAHYAEIVVGRERSGRPITISDAQIAAICRSQGAQLATRNVDDFTDTGITVINPWSASSTA